MGAGVMRLTNSGYRTIHSVFSLQFFLTRALFSISYGVELVSIRIGRRVTVRLSVKTCNACEKRADKFPGMETSRLLPQHRTKKKRNTWCCIFFLDVYILLHITWPINREHMNKNRKEHGSLSVKWQVMDSSWSFLLVFTISRRIFPVIFLWAAQNTSETIIAVWR